MQSVRRSHDSNLVYSPSNDVNWATEEFDAPGWERVYPHGVES